MCIRDRARADPCKKFHCVLLSRAAGKIAPSPLLNGISAVSYTHLDVYKRQLHSLAHQRIEHDEQVFPVAQLIGHPLQPQSCLDVYKRQRLHRRYRG